MGKKQSSPELSSLASKYVRMSSLDMAVAALRAAGFFWGRGRANPEFFRDIRKLAASVLLQDETRGQKR